MARPVRLGKAASELNVGVQTLIDFLKSKEIAMEFTPNTKLEEEHLEILRAEFAEDQDIKEKSKSSAGRVEVKESISLKDQRNEDKVEEPKRKEEDVQINVDEIKRQVMNIDEPVVEKKPEETKKKTLSVIGKIDLESIDSKKKNITSKSEEKESSKTKAKVEEKDKQTVEIKETTPEVKEEEEKAKEEEKKVEETVIEAEDAKSDNSKEEVEEKSKAEDEKPSGTEIETIKVNRKVLSGPTVLGKIELPVETPKKSSSQKESLDRKRKRKRIKKITPTVGAKNKPDSKFGGKKGKEEKKEVSAEDIQKEIKETLARLSNKGGKSKGSKNRRAKREVLAQKRQEEMEMAELEQKVLKLTEFVTVSELATMMNVQSTQVISSCMSLGIFASINQRIDAETIQIIAEEFGFETEFVSAEVQESIQVYEDNEEDLENRPPIITVMGHVDHGKTSLLDRIRDAKVTEGEAGGITQHIGAYSVSLNEDQRLTFLDTPGHEAFTAMRARGAQVTDVAIIIVAADDDVMPQTKEAISHAQAAGVPMIFAINKIDKPGANPEKVKEQLSNMNILVEEWGGKYQSQEISAKQNKNIDLLLEKILLEAEMLNLKANPNKNAVGTVVESSLDKGKGYVTNLLVQAGTMKIGDVVLVGRFYGKVRAMHDEKGNQLKEAGPSQPVAVLGINGAPSAGDKFNVLSDEREARTIATKREQLYREQGLRTTKHITLDEIGRRLAIGDFKELNLIVKGDVDGSIEALSDAMLKLSTEEIQVNIIHKGVGAISEADVNLASASDAIIIGFQVRPTGGARKIAENEQIDIRLYSVIYKAIEEIKSAMEGMLSPDIEENITGSAEIRETFDITKVGTVAGCYVLNGTIKRNSKIRVIRDGIVVHTGTLGSLKRFKDDVKEVKNNFECGLNIEKYNNIKPNDIIEAFEEVEVARTL
tara:strand:+ start:2185 stop:4989 length:2805 start_codon:yes stop_codon:yes gene_type:complete